MPITRVTMAEGICTHVDLDFIQRMEMDRYLHGRIVKRDGKLFNGTRNRRVYIISCQQRWICEAVLML